MTNPLTTYSKAIKASLQAGNATEHTRHQRMVVAMSETIRLTTEIDDAIPEWPIQ